MNEKDSSRYKVKELISAATADDVMEGRFSNLELMINKDIELEEGILDDKYGRGYYLYIVDIKYHTQYAPNSEANKLIHSALMIYEVRKEGVEY